MKKTDVVLALYYPIAIVILSLTKIPEATLFLTLLAYLIMIKSELAPVFSFFSSVFILALPHSITSILTAAVVANAPLLMKIGDMDKMAIFPVIGLIFLRLKLGLMLVPLAVVYYLLKGDSRYFTGCAIVLLIATAYLLTITPESYANKIAVYAYYMLVIGVLGALLEYLREGESNGNAKDEAV